MHRSENPDERFQDRLDRLQRLDRVSGLYLGVFAVGAAVAGAGYLLGNGYVLGSGGVLAGGSMAVGYTTEHFVRWEQSRLEALQPGCTESLFGPRS